MPSPDLYGKIERITNPKRGSVSLYYYLLSVIYYLLSGKEVMKMAKKQFKTESKKLLDMMVNSIYTHKEIFLRELIRVRRDRQALFPLADRQQRRYESRRFRDPSDRGQG